MASLNRVFLIGNLGSDPELKYTGTGTAVANFSLATSYKTKEGESQVEWHRIIVWKEQAENCSKYLRKGSLAYVDGRLQTRTWDDKQGVKHYTTEIVAERVIFLTPSGTGTIAPKGEGENARETRSKHREVKGDVPSDDDLPF
jgi:single-strand DNA-binding protein